MDPVATCIAWKEGFPHDQEALADHAEAYTAWVAGDGFLVTAVLYGGGEIQIYNLTPEFALGEDVSRQVNPTMIESFHA